MDDGLLLSRLFLLFIAFRVRSGQVHQPRFFHGQFFRFFVSECCCTERRSGRFSFDPTWVEGKDA